MNLKSALALAIATLGTALTIGLSCVVELLSIGNASAMASCTPVAASE